MRRLHATSISLLLLLGVACRSPSAPVAGPTVDEARALALTAPAGDGPVEREISRIQERLRRAPAPDDWVLLGQAWIQKARRAGDPGLVLGAEGASIVALSMMSGHRGALGLRALVLLDQHRFAEARAQASALLSRDAGDLVALTVLSDAALEMGDVTASREAAQRLVDLKPGLASYGRAAHLRWVGGDVPGAKLLYARAIEAGRGARDAEPVAWMVVQAALVFWNEGDVDGALAGAREALALVPGYAPALVLEARCRLARGDEASAVRLLELAHEARPLFETGWLLADARRQSGDESGAERVEARLLRQGRQSDPLMLGLFLATRGRDLPEALRLLEAEHRARPGIAVEDARAWALFRAGKLAEARTAIDRATAQGTPDPRLLYHAGAIRLAQGEVEEGRALVRRALDLNPRFDPVASAEARVLLAGSKREARLP
jgi:tetratricopeptide (TPR) repeat protein